MSNKPTFHEPSLVGAGALVCKSCNRLLSLRDAADEQFDSRCADCRSGRKTATPVKHIDPTEPDKPSPGPIRLPPPPPIYVPPYQPPPAAHGWQCPRCGAVNGPHVDRCGCSPQQVWTCGAGGTGGAPT